MKLAVITGGGANFYSIEVALQRMGVEYELTTDKNVINAADGAILPGVGSAAYAMNELARHGLCDTLRNYKKPLLGICLGMQLLYESSEEGGDVKCLGILPGKIRKFIATAELIVPQMGWNNFSKLQESALLNEINLAKDVYFVHSYYAPVNQVTVAACDYGVKFAAMAAQDNFYAMQFHPEKSGSIGEQLLANFIAIVQQQAKFQIEQ
ncbi:MAG: imidazole glycerol phosphate synthase subunit HisH [Burkholderiales bacterium]|nr:imidazole glycerol phosphate synthase subunit HisH [Burkholderiales bacterium]